MEPWGWGLIAGVPIIVGGIAYGIWSSSKKNNSLIDNSSREFRGDSMNEGLYDTTYGTSYTSGGRRKKTNKSKSKHKKTKRHH